jgi:hypothetical protein
MEIYTHKEFKDVVYGKNGLPIFPKLETTIKYFSFRDLQHCYVEEIKKQKEETIYIVMYNNKNIIGIVKLGLNIYIKTHKQMWIAYFSIDEKYQEKGLSHKMLETLFSYSKENNIVLEGSRRSDKGKERLGKNIDKYSNLYNIKYIPSQFNI